MATRSTLPISICAAILLAVLGFGRSAAGDGAAAVIATADPSGQLRTLNANGAFDPDNPFFQDLGTNGRRCVTCHQPTDAWSITPANVQFRFVVSGGTDPIFRSNDGSTCEGAAGATFAERADAYPLLLTRGLIRVGLDVPRGAEFTIDSVSDPNACGPASTDASLYRRPLPSTNLRFLSAVMWDGRESSPSTSVLQDLGQQARDATRGHAQASRDLTDAEVAEIVAFETGLSTAQARDHAAGGLAADGARGGVSALAGQAFFTGINDPAGLNPSGDPFDPNAFTLFGAWSAARGRDPASRQRRAIARGEALFNAKPITIAGVAGLNGETFSSGVTIPASFTGSCTICHDTPNVGNHSVKAPLDIGIADPSRAPYLPVYTLRNLSTNQTVQVTDPGRAMVTGKWKDVGKFKGPVLRALAARAPYFHNGSAATLEEVVDFYDVRFGIGFTAQEKADLVAFLRAL